MNVAAGSRKSTWKSETSSERTLKYQTGGGADISAVPVTVQSPVLGKSRVAVKKSDTM